MQKLEKIPPLNYSLKDAIFTPKYGVGIITKIDASNELFMVRFLETNKEIPIGFSSSATRKIKNFDPELALERELLSNDMLLTQRRELSNLKNSGKRKTSPSTKKSPSKKVSADALADKILETAMRGEKLFLKDLM